LGSAGYTSPYWLTFKQAKEIGDYVRKGEQGSPVVFRQWLEKDEARQDREETRTDSRRIPLARLYSVFNIQQCELPARLQPLLAIPAAQGADTYQQLAACEQILSSMPNRPQIEHGEARAYYLKLQRRKPMTRLLREAVDQYLQVYAEELEQLVKEAEANLTKRRR
jgi:antirestriction protein ArdC